MGRQRGEQWMGWACDVGLAVGLKSLSIITDNAEKLVIELLEIATVHQKTDENGATATLYVWENINWNRGYWDTEALYHLLEKCPEEDYRIIVACPEYPDHDDDDAGHWFGNPFDLHKESIETLQFS